MKRTIIRIIGLIMIIPLIYGFNTSLEKESVTGSCCISFIILGLSDPEGYYIEARDMSTNELYGLCQTNSKGECDMCTLPEDVPMKVGVITSWKPSCSPVANVICSGSPVSVPIQCSE
ncbi:MAG: hypothetical protein L0Y79_08970 [Chlorobi bacterium]|nr:hypothetical protein [Chlorobiota bacterium]MCI0716341.1 hypothetical protein [Chlorobiota bacterium]